MLLTPHHSDLPVIISWQQGSADQDFRITAVTRAEIAYGIAILPDGAKKQRLTDAASQFFCATASWTLPFGIKEADMYGIIVAARRAAGHPIGVLDAQIAAIARVAGAVVATRNTRDFLQCGIAVVNPYAI
ncbi:MAG: VapC toxin family PIN domain ribonuclease [Propionibacteriaceae bacterium]|nr:VapC toxin family PIN domain ribonuclease [Propionibacteriaceae bacterium]